MDLNLGIFLFVVVLAVLLIFFMIRKNRKDQRDLEEKIKRTELGVDHHKADRI